MGVWRLNFYFFSYLIRWLSHFLIRFSFSFFFILFKRIHISMMDDQTVDIHEDSGRYLQEYFTSKYHLFFSFFLYFFFAFEINSFFFLHLFLLLFFWFRKMF